MRKSLLLLLLPLVALGACSRGGNAPAPVADQSDSVAYVIGMNVGYNLQRMDSTLRVEALCRGLRDAFAGQELMTPEEAKAFYLRYVNVAIPEQIRAHEEQFLEDFRLNNRSYARTEAGITYQVLAIGDEKRTPRRDDDSLVMRYVVKDIDGRVVESTFERGDTLRTHLASLLPGVQQSVKLIGEGGRINAWIPARLAYGATGNDSLQVEANATLFYEIELLEVLSSKKKR